MSVKVEVGVVSPVEGFLMCDSAEGEAERAGGKKTCQNEMAVERSEASDTRRDHTRRINFGTPPSVHLVNKDLPLSKANTLAPGCRLMTKA